MQSRNEFSLDKMIRRLVGTVSAEGVVKIKEITVTDYELIQRTHPQDMYNCILVASN